jgi:16S rRNA (cytosine967-C5)-methyltransferase
MVTAHFLLAECPDKFLENADPVLNEKTALPFDQKCRLLITEFDYKSIFPFPELLSAGITQEDYNYGMLHQPDLFLRIRPAFVSKLNSKLAEAGNISGEGPFAVRLNSGFDVAKHFEVNKEIVIQDLHSQRTGDIIKAVFTENAFIPKQCWDCCAASGGKSIMLADLFPGIALTVSDIRQSILSNLETRFREAGIRPRQRFIADIGKPGVQLPVKQTDFILADVPCTGSGTWSRTPEQLYYFKPSLVDDYAKMQRAIITNIARYLKTHGWLVYITCSVFKEENEGMVEYCRSIGFNLIYTKLLNGTRIKADSMFVAVFQKNA